MLKNNIIMETKEKKLKVGDMLYREYHHRWGRTQCSVEVIDRCTKTLAISKNGVRYKIDCYYDAKTDTFAGKEQGEYFQYDKLLSVDEVDSYVAKVADYGERCMMYDWVKGHKFTADEAVMVYKLLNK